MEFFLCVVCFSETMFLETLIVWEPNWAISFVLSILSGQTQIICMIDTAAERDDGVFLIFEVTIRPVSIIAAPID